MYTFGVFCSEQGAEDECVCAVRRCVDGCESQCRAWKGGDFFSLLENIYLPFYHFLAFRCLTKILYHIAFQQFLAKKKRICSAHFVILKILKSGIMLQMCCK